MVEITTKDMTAYVEQHIDSFHQNRLAKFGTVKLRDIAKDTADTLRQRKRTKKP